MKDDVVARSERIADLVRLSIGMRDPAGALRWRCRHLPLHRLHGPADQVQRLVFSACRDMWGEAADKSMVQAAFAALDDRVLWAHHASPYIAPAGTRPSSYVAAAAS